MLPKRFKAKNKLNAKSRHYSKPRQDKHCIPEKTKKQNRQLNKKLSNSPYYEEKYRDRNFESNYETYYESKENTHSQLSKFHITHFPDTNNCKIYWEKFHDLQVYKVTKILNNYFPADICWIITSYLDIFFNNIFK